MSTGHTILTICALMLLTTILLSFYRLLADNGDVIAGGQDGILMNTLAATYLELASGLAYDSVTDTTNLVQVPPTSLTLPLFLGPESVDEDSVYDFNDVDDFNGFVVEDQPNGTTRRYRTVFRVQYVRPADPQITSAVQTWTKRLDLRTWRVFPPGETDTLRLSTVMGYFRFN
jgi:hypothetical protein